MPMGIRISNKKFQNYVPKINKLTLLLALGSLFVQLSAFMSEKKTKTKLNNCIFP